MSIYLLVLYLIFCDATAISVRLQIFDRLAEVSRSISPDDLPITFSRQEWNTIRADSFRLIADYVQVQAQMITSHQPSLNGEKILIQRSSNNQTYTPAIMIDESRNLIQDLIDQTYYTIDSSRIRYMSPPSIANYTVDFTFATSHPEQLYVRYLQNNIRWKVRYDLVLNNDEADTFLQAYADIRYDGPTSLMVDAAELISGDINLQTYTAYQDYETDARPAFFGASTAPAMSVSGADELAGIYLYSINHPFQLPARSNYVLPMFRPSIVIDRYAIIDKSFARTDNRGQAKRGYRLRVPDQYLPRGSVLIRESNRLVGEISWSDRSANDTNQFQLGEDPDLQYSEKVQLLERRQVYEMNGYRLILSTYTIQVRLINRKSRPIPFEYRLRFPSQENLTLKDNQFEFELDGSSVIGRRMVEANSDEQIEFTVETQ